LDGRESPDMNHWTSINSGGDMDIDSKPFLTPESTNTNNRNTNRAGTNNTTMQRRGIYE
ncbi:unnamed protein product, partial [Rotaria sp. Silwood1]